MPDDSPESDAPPTDATSPTDAAPQEAPPVSEAASTDTPPAKPKRAPRGGWAYIGAAYIPGVPMRDLTPEDLDDLEREGWNLTEVLKTGVYRASPSAAKALADKEPS